MLTTRVGRSVGQSVVFVIFLRSGKSELVNAITVVFSAVALTGLSESS